MRNNSEDVKRELCELLAGELRFRAIVDLVAERLKAGQAPVVIESWNTYCYRTLEEFSVWADVLTAQDYDSFVAVRKGKQPDVKLQAVLKSLDEPQVVMSYPGKAAVYITVPDYMRTQLIFWGYRDRNYLKLLFQYLGYQVTEGNANGRYGLQINFGK